MKANRKTEGKTVKAFSELTTAEKIEVQAGRLNEAKAAGNKSGVKSYKRALKHLREELREEQNPEPAMVTLTGKIKKQTDKAILLHVIECHDMIELQGAEVWLPTSQVNVARHSMGPFDSVRCPEWLATSKVG